MKSLGGRPPSSSHSPTPPDRASLLARVGTSGAGRAGGRRRSRESGSAAGGVFGAVGYFELEQRLREDGMVVDTAGSGLLGPGISLKVYGDVWKWLGDEKVNSLKEQVVEAHFSHIHVNSVARRAATIAEVSKVFYGSAYLSRTGQQHYVC